VKARDRNPKPAGRATKLWRRHGGMILGALALVVLAVIVWHLLSGTASTKREVAATPMLMLPPPPPPPPEPEKLPEPQPDKVKPEVADIKPSPVDKPQDDAPAPKDNSDPVTIKGDAQAGNDAFGVRAGSGGGSSGTGGLGGSSYSRYVSSILQQALARDPRTRQLVFDDIRIDVWLAADGKTARAQLVQSTGNATTDEAVLAMVRDLDRIDERPPASMRFPMRVSMRGRRP
jgi:periplasmic protein TonB